MVGWLLLLNDKKIARRNFLWADSRNFITLQRWSYAKTNKINFSSTFNTEHRNNKSSIQKCCYWWWGFAAQVSVALESVISWSSKSVCKTFENKAQEDWVDQNSLVEVYRNWHWKWKKCWWCRCYYGKKTLGIAKYHQTVASDSINILVLLMYYWCSIMKDGSFRCSQHDHLWNSDFPLTKRTACYWALRVHLQVTQRINLQCLDPTKWAWKFEKVYVVPIKTDIDHAPEFLLNLLDVNGRKQ